MPRICVADTVKAGRSGFIQALDSKYLSFLFLYEMSNALEDESWNLRPAHFSCILMLTAQYLAH
jgi:hypothetical protein